MKIIRPAPEAVAKRQQYEVEWLNADPEGLTNWTTRQPWRIGRPGDRASTRNSAVAVLPPNGEDAAAD